MPAYKTIKISVDENGNFCYSPSVLRTQAGDVINWECDDGPFAIMFKEDTPFHNLDQQGEPVRSLDAFGRPGGPSAQLSVRDGARGHFPYAVAVATGDRVFLDSGCPDLIVN